MKGSKNKENSEGLFNSTAKMLYKIARDSISIYTGTKDYIRNIGKDKIKSGEKQIYVKHFEELLSKMKVNTKIRSQVLDNVKNATIVIDLSRAKEILTVFHKHGLNGKAADHFFLGGHFRLDDGGGLFEELKSLEGAETRFSSHFSKIRQEELGINSGRILPEVLFLNTIENGKTYSHFQAEASPWRMPPKKYRTLKSFTPNRQTLQNMEHICDSIVYFAAKEYAKFTEQTIYNRSNYGWSPYADSNPITSMDTLPTLHTEDIENIEALLELDPEPDSIVQLKSRKDHDIVEENELEDQKPNTL